MTVSRLKILVLLFMFASLCLVSRCDAQNADSLEKEVVQGWQKLQELNTIANGKTVMKFNTGQPETISRWAVQGEYQKLETEEKASFSTTHQTCKLQKNSDGEWQIVSIADETDRQVINIGSRADESFSISGISLLDAMDDEDFSFAGWHTSDTGMIGFDLTNLVEEKLNSEGKPHPPAPFEKISVLVDPTHNCRIMSYEHAVASGGRTAEVTGRYDYDDSFPHFPIFKINSSQVAGKSKPYEITWTFSDVTNQRIPASEFSLTHYGLKEVFQPSGSSPLIYLAGAVLLAITAFASVKFLRRS